MGRISSVRRMDPRIREVIDGLIRQGNHTIDEIVVHLEDMGAGGLSRSAIGRYKKSAEEAMESYRRAQEVSKVWVAEFGQEPESRVGKMAIELAKANIHRLMMGLGEGEIKDVEALSRAIKNVAAADHLTTANLARIREAVRAEERERMQREVAKMRQEAGFDAMTLNAVEERVSIYLPANTR